MYYVVFRTNSYKDKEKYKRKNNAEIEKGPNSNENSLEI